MTDTAHPTGYPSTPELDRLLAVAPFSQHVGDFLDWLAQEGFVLAKHACPHGNLDHLDCEESKYCRRGDETPVLWAQHVNPEATLAAFYDIDLNKIEAERRAVLEYLRSENT